MKPFTGQQLKFMEVGGIGSSERRLYLCADGRAYYWAEGGFATAPGDLGEGVSGAHESSASGHWGVQGNTLLAVSDGEQFSWTIQARNDYSVLLDGEVWHYIYELDGYCD